MRTFRLAVWFTAILLGAGTLAMGEMPTDRGTPDKKTLAQVAEQKGDMARTHKDYEAAFGFYSDASRLDPRNAAIVNKMAVTKLQLHDRPMARKLLRHANSLDPKNTSVLNNLGAVYYLDKKYEQSIKYLKQSLALDETNATCHLNIAESWLSLGQMDRAMTEYARALELDADILTTAQDGIVAQVRTPAQRARINYFIAKAYARRGNLDGALEYLQRAKDGHFPDLRQLFDDKDFAALWNDPRLEKIIRRS